MGCFHHYRGRRGRAGNFDAAVSVGDGRVWKGTAFGGVKGRSELPDYVEWYLGGKIKLDSMITHTMPLEDINRAFELMHAGASIRSVILY